MQVAVQNKPVGIFRIAVATTVNVCRNLIAITYDWFINDPAFFTTHPSEPLARYTLSVKGFNSQL